MSSQFQEFSDIIGEQATSILFGHFAGERLRIPISMPTNHKLAVLLSYEVAEQLSHWFPAYILDVPTGNNKNWCQKHNEIIKLWSDGWSVPRIARYLRISRRTVFKRLRIFTLKGKSKKPHNAIQLSLFD